MISSHYKFRTIALLLSLCSLTGIASSAGTETGTISPDWNIYGDGNIFFYLSGTHANSPCSMVERWAFDTTTPVGKSFYSAFLTAYSTGKEISLTGNGTCIHGNTEEVFDFHVR